MLTHTDVSGTRPQRNRTDVWYLSRGFVLPASWNTRMPGQERAGVFAGIRRFTAADTAAVARIAPQASRVTTSATNTPPTSRRTVIGTLMRPDSSRMVRFRRLRG